MICAVIPTLNDEARLVAALAPLVPAAMAGTVRELIVVDAGSTDATLEIADDAGAKILATDRPGWAGAQAGIAAAKGPWLMLLDPSVILEFGWEAAARAHVGTRQTPARFRLERREKRLFGPKPPLGALLIPKSAAEAGLVLEPGGFRLRHGVGQVHLLDARGLV